MTTSWFTSDLHIGHALVSRLRAEAGMCPAAEHDDFLAEQWDSRVRTGDTVYVLGDLTVGNGRGPNVRAALDWIHARPGVKHLISGNHDEVWPGNRDARANLDWAHGWPAAFKTIQPFGRIRVAGQSVLMSHFPYPGTSEGTDASGNEYDDRYLQYRLADLGSPLLHGHVHRPYRLTPSPQRGSRMIHVGVDAWAGAPVHLSQVEDLLTTRMWEMKQG